MGKTIHCFNTVEEYEHNRKNNYSEPWVSAIRTTNQVNYNKTEEEKRYDEMLETPLTFEILSDGNIIWAKGNSAQNKTIEYSKDNGETWTSITSSTGGTQIPVTSGETIQFRGDNTRYGTNSVSYSYANYFSASTVQYNVYGNIMSLIDSVNFKTNNTLSGTCSFTYLFYSNGIIEAENLILPAKNLTKYCYGAMFGNCSNLTTAPKLPATTLADNCYEGMFSNCTSLTTAPALPAKTLRAYCYERMFQNCSNLTTVPELPATTLASYCCHQMFDSCRSLTTVPSILPATALSNNCYDYMFNGCTSLTTAPELPATTLEYGCYRQMFYNCSGLTTAPELPATTLADNCYEGMFRGCTSLTTVPSILPATTLANYCYNYMFYGCTNLTTAPDLPATALTNNCYGYMFRDCSNLNYIKCLATDISASGCVSNWLYGVASSGTFVKNSSMSSWTTGASGIPSNWTVQDAT